MVCYSTVFNYMEVFYNEIHQIDLLCKELNIRTRLVNLWGGYKLEIEGCGDIIYHRFSAGCEEGLLEVCLFKFNCRAFKLEKIKKLIKRSRHKIRRIQNANIL